MPDARSSRHHRVASRRGHREGDDVKKTEKDERQRHEERAQDEEAPAPQHDETEDPRQPAGVKVTTRVRSGGYLWND